MRVHTYSVSALARMHKALGDETRLRIVHLLTHRGELCVCDVESALDISQSKASRHLTYLKHAGIVDDRRDRTWIYYRLVRGNSALASAIRAQKKILADDPQVQADLRAADDCCRDAACSPIELSRKA